MKYSLLKNSVVPALSLALMLGSWQANVQALAITHYTQQDSVRHAIMNEIVKATASIARKNKAGATELSSYWNIKDSAGNILSLESLTENDIHLINTNDKEAFVRSLPFSVKEHIFSELGDMLLNEARPRPFNINVSTLCQWDVFLVITCVLLENEQQFTPLINALNSCFGCKEIWKIQGRLNKKELYALIPQSLQNKLFTTAPMQMLKMKTRISNLINCM